MTRPRVILAAVLLLTAACAPATTVPAAPAPAPDTIGNPAAQLASSVHGVVASATPEATAVGAQVLAEGGNAIDAAVAIGFALAVTEPSMSGLGGRASLIVRGPDGSVHGIDGLNQVPQSYRPKSGIPAVYERAAVPGVPAALASALVAHGTWPLDRVLAPAIALAEQGFVLGEAEAARWAAARKELAAFGAGLGTYLKADGSPWRAGDRAANPLLAATLRRLAAEGVASFYRGGIAEEIDRDMAAHGGFLRRDDLAAYEALPALVVTGTYRGHTMASNFRPAAGHAVIQALQTMEGIAIPGVNEPARWAAVVGQAMQLAIADRSVRRGSEAESAAWLTSMEHARERASHIVVPTGSGDPTRGEIGPFPRTLWRQPPGTMVVAPTDREATTHASVADRDGRVVALTQSLGPAMGTRLVAPGLGFIYATRLGTVPGSRPASTISPTILVGPGESSVVALGGAGDARIISAVIQVISRLVDHRMSLAEAVAAPRVHPEREARTLRVEEGPVASWAGADRARLERWGFTLISAPSGFFGRVHAVRREADGSPAIGVAEPRWTGGAAGPLTLHK